MTTLETLLRDPDAAGTWSLLPDRSTITFKIKNMWGLVNVKGKFTEFSGTGELADGGAVSGRVEVRVESIDSGIGRRDRHLLSADFFDAERYPQITVDITALQPTAGRRADLQAQFTIKGNTEAVPFPAAVTELDDGSVRISGEATLDRAKFGLDWNKLGVMSESVKVAAELVFERAGGR
ncbi:hypothetical protein MKUB_13610 [Mycobacterium kubicae]|uniref:YceI family protein n=1 Tax=Mycobacterium kubicae TaxID=120959 RepID=A0AAX1JCN2_9MYCO|nr:YceI family protein [Mycobacterium kubicae]MCV7095715.1 YceI family protein [Mycobacterium kubicae]ORV94967.1 hypothetical protein AWC13_21635 [Mycobacterium kubicae]QNI11097.1 YceI family protein [Mycobacterium kubicae]QPI39309.1 YceI family protein [Mycobacterium kubicae]GFG63871.1 hypothetical protein MKUB_13610 [Mycobacterium kubicae]